MRYPLRFSRDDDGSLVVVCPDLPEVTTFGEDETEAARRGTDAVITAIIGRIADRRDVPAPTPGPPPHAIVGASDSLKIDLYLTMRAKGIGKADLARRLGCHLPQVDRLLDLSHESKLDRLETAARALGREIEIRLVPAA